MHYKFDNYYNSFLGDKFNYHKNNKQFLNNLCVYYDKNCSKCIQIAGGKNILKINNKKKIKRKYVLIE